VNHHLLHHEVSIGLRIAGEGTAVPVRGGPTSMAGEGFERRGVSIGLTRQRIEHAVNGRSIGPTVECVGQNLTDHRIMSPRKLRRRRHGNRRSRRSRSRVGVSRCSRTVEQRRRRLLMLAGVASHRLGVRLASTGMGRSRLRRSEGVAGERRHRVIRCRVQSRRFVAFDRRLKRMIRSHVEAPIAMRTGIVVRFGCQRFRRRHTGGSKRTHQHVVAVGGRLLNDRRRLRVEPCLRGRARRNKTFGNVDREVASRRRVAVAIGQRHRRSNRLVEARRLHAHRHEVDLTRPGAAGVQLDVSDELPCRRCERPVRGRIITAVVEDRIRDCPRRERAVGEVDDIFDVVGRIVVDEVERCEADVGQRRARRIRIDSTGAIRVREQLSCQNGLSGDCGTGVWKP